MGNALPNRVQRYNKICGYARKKSHFGAIFGETEKWKRKKGSEDDNRDNHSVAPTLCHGKEHDTTKILHYQNYWGTIYRHELLQRRMERMKRIWKLKGERGCRVLDGICRVCCSHRDLKIEIFMGYSRSIRGVFTGYSYVSVMCRLCIGTNTEDGGDAAT